MRPWLFRRQGCVSCLCWRCFPFLALPSPPPHTITTNNVRTPGPVLGWLWVIEACRQLKVELPVNIKMVFEGMEESGSIGLDEVIDQEKNA